jgi:hypothetical protein
MQRFPPHTVLQFLITSMGIYYVAQINPMKFKLSRRADQLMRDSIMSAEARMQNLVAAYKFGKAKSKRTFIQIT